MSWTTAPASTPYFRANPTLRLGTRRYELTDHLGNVRALIGDRRTLVNAGNAATQYYSAAVLNGTDYFPFGSEMRSSTLAKYRYGFNGKELDRNKEFDILNQYDYGFRIYNPGIGRFLSVDPLMVKYPSWSPYNYTLGNPIRFIDPDGRSVKSTHTDSEGRVVAVYNDGDLGVYRHREISSSTNLDDARSFVDNKRSSTKMRSGGGEFMGRTLHEFSFTDFGDLEKGVISAKGSIDFNSHWALEAVQGIMWDMQGKSLVHYGLNAGQNQKYDVKSVAFKEFGSVSYGSILYNDGESNIYASARDAGNFAAGEVKRSSSIPNYFTSVGIGSFNYARSKFYGALFSLEKFILDVNPDPFSFGPYSPLKAPYYGEDLGTGKAISAGKEYYKKKPYLYNLNH